MCDKAVDIYPSIIEYVPDRFKTQEMCDKAIDKCLFVFNSIPDQYKTQEMCDKIVSEDPFKLKYCQDRCKIREMCNKAFDEFLPALKIFPDWFVASKIIKRLNALYTDDYILYFNEDSGDPVFSCNKMSILSVYLNNTNFDDTTNDGDDVETVLHIRLLAGHIKF